MGRPVQLLKRQRANLSYWRSFTDDFFVDGGGMSYTLSSDDLDAPQKLFGWSMHIYRANVRRYPGEHPSQVVSNHVYIRPDFNHILPSIMHGVSCPFLSTFSRTRATRFAVARHLR